MAEESLYDYSPSIPAAIITAVVFAILLIVHLFRLFRTRTWFCIPFVIGAIFEIIGYLARAYGHNNPTSTNAYIVQALLILLAPILFAASVYMFLGRIIRASNCESYSMIRPRWTTKIFVGGDVLCFLVQGVGASILASADDKKASDLGNGIILGGLILQILIFGFFIVVAAVWHKRMRKMGPKDCDGWNWEGYLNMLYIVSIIITIRNLFRVIEYAMGEDGYLLTHEWPIYIFDAFLMVIVLGICYFWYVRKTLAKYEQDTLAAYEMNFRRQSQQALNRE